MPWFSEQINRLRIYHIVAMAVLAAIGVFCVIFAITGIANKAKKRNKVSEIIIFVAEWLLFALFVLFAALSIIGLVSENEVVTAEYAMIFNGETIYIPLLSSIFCRISSSTLFAGICGFAEAAALFGIIAQLIVWQRAKRKKSAFESEGKVGFTENPGEKIFDKNDSPEEEKQISNKTLEDEIVANFIPEKQPELMSLEEENECLNAIEPDKIAIKSDKKGRVCTLGNKTILKSDAAAVYVKYLEEKKARGSADE